MTNIIKKLYHTINFVPQYLLITLQVIVVKHHLTQDMKGSGRGNNKCLPPSFSNHIK